MFKQIVSNLSLSPAAAGQLSFYAKRLKQEKITRTFSVIAAVLLIGLQFTVISAPSKPSNAASPSDLIPGGFQSLTELLSDYDRSPELQAVYGRWGVTRNDLVHSSRVQINSRDHSLNSLGRVKHFAGDTAVPIYNETFWARYLYQFDTGSNVQSGSYYYVQTGISSTGQYYAIMYRCGNIVFHKIPTPPPTTVVDQGHELYCTSLSGTPSSGKTPLTVTFKSVASGHNETVTAYHYNFGDNSKQDSTSATTSHIYKTAGTYKATLTVTGSAGNTTALSTPCSFTISTTTTPPPPPPPPPAPPKLVLHKVAQNLTQNKDATKQDANAGEVIRYTLSIKNTGGTDTSYSFSDDITDILEYATVSKLGGGKVTTNATTNVSTIAWPADDIKAGATVKHSFEITVKNPIPPTPVSTSDQFSYDLCMDNVFGDTVRVCVTPPPPKTVETTSTTLPDTGAGTSTFILLAFAAFVTYFYARNRQLVAEVRILRGEYQGGTAL